MRLAIPAMGAFEKGNKRIMTNTKKPTKATALAGLLALIAGIQKHYSGQTLHFAGQNVTSAALVTLFQAAIDASNAAKAAATQRATAVATATTSQQATANHEAHDDRAADLQLALVACDMPAPVGQQARPMAKGFMAMVLAASGSDTATLSDFELKPHKVTEPSPEVKAAAAVKAVATRKALGTKGSQQKRAAKKALAAQPAEATVPASPAVTAPKA